MVNTSTYINQEYIHLISTQRQKTCMNNTGQASKPILKMCDAVFLRTELDSHEISFAQPLPETHNV